MSAHVVEAAVADDNLRRDWRRVYRQRLALIDCAVVVFVVALTQIAWFGSVSSDTAVASNTRTVSLGYTTVSVILVVAWMALLSLYGSREDRVIGTGSVEYRIIFDSSIRLFGAFAIVAFLAQIDFSRGYLIVAFPSGTLLLLSARWLMRRWLNRQRQHGRYSAQVLLVGSEVSVAHTAVQLSRQPQTGYHVIGACVPGGTSARQLLGTNVEVVGSMENILESMEITGADTVVVTSSDDLPPERIRELSWSLEPGRQHLVVAPSLTDIGGPRIHTRPVAGLPFIHVETPRYEGFKRYQKRLFDAAGSGALVIILSPVLLVIAIVVRLSGPGTIFFRQERVGLNGSFFGMLKFRSMVSDAEAQLVGLEELERKEGNTVLFKMKNDPRITPIGRILRRYSLDELPQLFNVLRGEMSLIGPRPPLQKEVELYDTHVHRRFLMKPGITGLWQVSGRSDLSWEDSVRLDLYYVENWSMVGDFVILMKTAKAVFGSTGAY